MLPLTSVDVILSEQANPPRLVLGVGSDPISLNGLVRLGELLLLSFSSTGSNKEGSPESCQLQTILSECTSCSWYLVGLSDLGKPST